MRMCRVFVVFLLLFASLFAQDSKMQLDLSRLGNFNLFVAQCKKRDYNACYYLGMAYMQGYQVLASDTQGKKYLRLACQNNILESCLVLNQNINNTQDKINLYKKACDLNNLESCKKLAFILEQNVSIDSNNKDKAYLAELLQKICKLRRDSKCESLKEFQEKFMLDNDMESINECNAAIKQYKNIGEKAIADLQVCGQAGEVYANGSEDIKKDKQKAQEFYHYGCLANRIYCYKERLDSILNP